MSEGRTTLMLGGAALLLVLAAWQSAPRVRTPAVVSERGAVLFPDFQDPNAAASLEIMEFDARNAAVNPFKVENRNGRWTIPSQHDYPADAKDQLAKTAAAIIALRKDDFATDNPVDYERCGVIDPLDTTLPGVGGRGVRLVIRGTQDQALADFILGSPVEGHPGFRYLRQSGQRRVYISNAGGLRISTSFRDWIERDLLQVNVQDIDAVNLRNYTLDRSAGRVNPGETMLLQKTSDNTWTINGLAANEVLDAAALGGLLDSIAKLTISGVLPKPAGITATLSHETGSAAIAPADRADLARKGFYLAANGQLVSDRGEIVVRTDRGIFYTLRFGEVALDPDAAAGNGKPPAGAENRYLFLMADFDARSAATPARVAEGARKVELLRARFAPWFYVIAADSFAKIRLRRSDLVKVRSAAPARGK